MLYLHGLGHFHPKNVITNQFFEELDIGTTSDWILDRVGIRTRRTVLPLDYIRTTRNADPRQAIEVAEYSNAETGRRAALMAMERAGIEPEQIGMVIAGGCSPDNAIPAEACTIANELGIECICFDLNSACSSFGAQLHTLSLMRPEALPDFILLVSPENTTRTVDYGDRRSAVLWGDGTSAAIVSARVPARARLSFHTLVSSPKGWDKVVIPRLGHFEQEGSTVQTFAIKRSVVCLREIQRQFRDRRDDLIFVGHQANLMMLESVCRKCDIPPERHLSNVAEFGNTGAAGAPTVVSQNWDRFGDGDVVALVVVGSGLTWSSLAIEFNGAYA
jgi:3-oxoacyl-[acyl-carrier-protein] synthase-3